MSVLNWEMTSFTGLFCFKISRTLSFAISSCSRAKKSVAKSSSVGEMVMLYCRRMVGSDVRSISAMYAGFVFLNSWANFSKSALASDFAHSSARSLASPSFS